jgi:hypothetical protein
LRPADQCPIRRRLICGVHRVQDKTRITENSSTIPNTIIPPEPINGPWQIIRIIFQWNDTQRLCRVLLDWGASVPILNDKWARRNGTPIYKRATPRTIEHFTGTVEASMGHACSYPLRIQHRNHYSVDSFEIGPPSSDCDAILPFWWIAKHPPNRLYGSADDILFNQCKNCTRDPALKFSLEMDSGVLGYPEALVIGSISSNDDDNALTESTKGDKKSWKWTLEMNKAFDELKK